MRKTKTVAARVTPQTARLLNTIAERENLSRSEVIERALINYGAGNKVRPAHEVLTRLTAAGFVGITATNDKLSTNYKRLLSDSLEKKHGHR